MNETSSRSHAVIQLQLEQGGRPTGLLSFIDLAGTLLEAARYPEGSSRYPDAGPEPTCSQQPQVTPLTLTAQSYTPEIRKPKPSRFGSDPQPSASNLEP
eukprot:3104257-Rhodomonas_salina.1